MLKPLLKECLISGLYGLGTLRPSEWPAVIIYHSFDECASPVSISAAAFREHLSIIKELGYKTITATDLIEARIGNEPLPERAVVLTFDDGLWNNYTVAFPLLREFGFTATIFLVTGYLGRLSTWERDPGISALPLLAWEHIREMHEYGIDFQSHTLSHPHLTRLNDKDLDRELLKSRGLIEDRLGKSAPLFCYPYGDFDSRVVMKLREFGFKAAFAGHPAGEDNYSINRVGSAHLTTGLSFKTALLGSFGHFYSLKRFVKKV